MGDEPSWIARLLAWFALAVAAIVALQLAGWIAGTVLGIAATALGIAVFLLFKIVPILVVAWLIVKFFRVFRPARDPGYP